MLEHKGLKRIEGQTEGGASPQRQNRKWAQFVGNNLQGCFLCSNANWKKHSLKIYFKNVTTRIWSPVKLQNIWPQWLLKHKWKTTVEPNFSELLTVPFGLSWKSKHDSVFKITMCHRITIPSKATVREVTKFLGQEGQQLLQKRANGLQAGFPSENTALRLLALHSVDSVSCSPRHMKKYIR